MLLSSISYGIFDWQISAIAGLGKKLLVGKKLENMKMFLRWKKTIVRPLDSVIVGNQC